MKQQEIERLVENITVDRDAIDHARILSDAETALEQSSRPAPTENRPLMWNRLPRSVWAAGLAAGLLIVVSSLTCFLLYRNVVDLKYELGLARQDILLAQPEDTTTINLYLQEHKDVVARYASQTQDTTPQPMQMRVNQDDVLYYELLDNGPGYMSPGVIVRGPSSQNQIDSSKAPAIANGHQLTLSEVRQAAGFDLVLPSWLDPGYALEQIRRIEGRDTLQLLYTDGINSISLFEQPRDGQRGLEPKDFREYAVYRNKEQAGGTILAWRDDARSYVLIGSIELSQLMNMAQSISVAK